MLLLWCGTNISARGQGLVEPPGSVSASAAVVILPVAAVGPVANGAAEALQDISAPAARVPWGVAAGAAQNICVSIIRLLVLLFTCSASCMSSIKAFSGCAGQSPQGSRR